MYAFFWRLLTPSTNNKQTTAIQYFFPRIEAWIHFFLLSQYAASTLKLLFPFWLYCGSDGCTD